MKLYEIAKFKPQNARLINMVTGIKSYFMFIISFILEIYGIYKSIRHLLMLDFLWKYKNVILYLTQRIVMNTCYKNYLNFDPLY